MVEIVLVVLVQIIIIDVVVVVVVVVVAVVVSSSSPGACVARACVRSGFASCVRAIGSQVRQAFRSRPSRVSKQCTPSGA
jgi:hypothetical protein